VNDPATRLSYPLLPCSSENDSQPINTVFDSTGDAAVRWWCGTVPSRNSGTPRFAG